MASAAGTVTCASTLPTATAMPSGSPVHAAACADSPPARSPRRPSGCSSLSGTNRAKSGLSAAQELRRTGSAPSWWMPL